MIHSPFYAISWQKLLADQRRLKREQEEADIAARRHTGVIPTHHQFITNERFGDLLNIDDTAKRKSGSEVCFGHLDLLLDPKQYLPSLGIALCRPDYLSKQHLSSWLPLGLLWLFSGWSVDMIPIMSCALYVQACLAAGPGSAGAHPECMP